MKTIVDQIVEKRREDLEKLGPTLGFSIPEKRERGKPLPFLAQKGVILEVKRASPSKGDISPNLDAAATAEKYAAAGTSAISVLTESHWFKGNLTDLQNVCKAVDDYCAKSGRKGVAVLRKDFLVTEEEIEVAYRCGADAVLLIARILTKEKLLSMAKTVEKLGMTALLELREDEDLEKLAYIAKEVGESTIVCGVNSRDLATFQIDLSRPVEMAGKIRQIIKETTGSEKGRVIFESGIKTPQMAAQVSQKGFSGMLLGEAAVRDVEKAKDLVAAFMN